MANTTHSSEGQRSWAEAWDLALDNKGIMYQLLYKYLRGHSLPFYKGDALRAELESFAWEGFFEACRRWDESKGLKLSTYAWPAVQNAMNARMIVLERMGSTMTGKYTSEEKGIQRPRLSSMEALDERRAAQYDSEGQEYGLADIYQQPWARETEAMEDVVIDAVYQAETVERIRKHVSSMSEPHKTVFELMYFTPPTHPRNLNSEGRGLGSGYTLSEVAKKYRRSTTWAREILDECFDYIRFQLEAESEGE